MGRPKGSKNTKILTNTEPIEKILEPVAPPEPPTGGISVIKPEPGYTGLPPEQPPPKIEDEPVTYHKIETGKDYEGMAQALARKLGNVPSDLKPHLGHLKKARRLLANVGFSEEGFAKLMK